MRARHREQMTSPRELCCTKLPKLDSCAIFQLFLFWIEFWYKHVNCWYMNYLSSSFELLCKSLLIDFIWIIWWSCLRCQVVICCLRCLRCKLLSPCILIPLGAYALWAFALYDKGLYPVSFCSLCWGLMPCECIYALMLRAHALDGATCMIKKLKLHSRVKSLLIRCYPWVLSC